MSELNIPMLQKLRERLLDEARVEAFNMGDWLTKRADPEDQPDQQEKSRAHACGTSACIAGHVVLMTPKNWVDGNPKLVQLGGKPVTVMDYAQKILGLTREQAMQLFLVTIDPTLSKVEEQEGDYDISTISAAEAAKAVQNVITYGEPKWGDILDV